jgi:glycerate kinase
VRVLIAPDSFTGSLSAAQAAEAIALGWSQSAAHDALTLLPLSDGGPGFADVFAGQPGARVEAVTVRGPLGDPTPGQIVVNGDVAYIESAQACGRHLLDAVSSETVMSASTSGVGEMLRAALAIDGVHTITIGLGGSASNDGGAGLIEALGGLEAARLLCAGRSIIVATDVDNPMLGPQGSTAVYGPQKGAKPADIPVLEQRLERWVEQLALLDAQVRSLAVRPGSGAAGGLGFALLALGGVRASGIEVVAAATGLRDRVAASDLVITGEGSFDWQSLRGKVVSGVAALASRVGVPVLVIAGQVLTGRREYSALGIESAYALAESPAEVEAVMADAAGALTRRAARIARSWSPAGS